jgi:hypothetical protein
VHVLQVMLRAGNTRWYLTGLYSASFCLFLQAQLEQEEQLTANLQQQLRDAQQQLQAAHQQSSDLHVQLQQAQEAADAAEQRAAALQAELDRAAQSGLSGAEQLATAQAAAAAAQQAVAGEAAARAAAEAALKDAKRRLAAAERTWADVHDRLEMKREQQMVVASGMANVSAGWARLLEMKLPTPLALLCDAYLQYAAAALPRSVQLRCAVNAPFLLTLQRYSMGADILSSLSFS